MPKYTIFGAGPSGLYTAWRLITSGKLSKLDSIEMIEWSNYSFSKKVRGDRLPAGRICTHHYEGKIQNSHIEMGGMRFLEWDGTQGHLLVSETIKELGLPTEKFEALDNPLFYLRGRHFYQEDGDFEAPYLGYENKKPNDLFMSISNKITGNESDNPGINTRRGQCKFYANGKLPSTTDSVVYKGGDTASNIGYWNFLYDQLGQEGYAYAAAGGGYSSNVINWNAANAAIYNGEFSPGGAYKTITGGFSNMFIMMYEKIMEASLSSQIPFTLQSGKRLQSIWQENGQPHFRVSHSDDPFEPEAVQTTDYVFLAMPKHSLELVAQGTKTEDMTGKVDFMNDDVVQNYFDSIIQQPSVKIGMFFNEPWWLDAKYSPKLSDGKVGPTVTDLPLRQVYYFGDNATSKTKQAPIYGLLAAYDDMQNTNFWQEMTLALDEQQTPEGNEDDDILEGPVPVPDSLKKMVLKQLSEVHFGDDDFAKNIPTPLETRFANWGLDPFGAGYHAWAPHYNITEVMQNIRFPAKAAGGTDNVFLVGSAYSNDQAWVEGAFCTAESVLIERFGLDPLASKKTYDDVYPLICDECEL